MENIKAEVSGNKKALSGKPTYHTPSLSSNRICGPPAL